jgi:hypothetical protein
MNFLFQEEIFELVIEGNAVFLQNPFIISD